VTILMGFQLEVPEQVNAIIDRFLGITLPA
jgi:hypothetical protein